MINSNENINVFGIDIKMYKQTNSPNMKRLSELLKIAKGHDRYMEQFAEECGYSSSWFSTIANCGITNPLDKDTLVSIAIHSENRELMLMQLLAANGMTTDEIDYDFEENRLDKIRDSLILGLVNRGIGVRRLYSIPELYGIKKYLPQPRFYISTDNNEIMNWMICLVLTPYCVVEEININSNYKNVSRFPYQRKAQEVIESFSSYFLHEKWDAASFEKVKTSFAFNDYRYMMEFYDILKNKEFSTRISLLLFDENKGDVIKEIHLENELNIWDASLYEDGIMVSDWSI